MIFRETLIKSHLRLDAHLSGGQKSYQYKFVFDKKQGFNMVERNTVNQNGVFEWIVDPTDGVTHRRFISNGTINGIPNQRPK